MIGAYEASLRERAVAVRRRLYNGRPPVPLSLEPPPTVVSEVVPDADEELTTKEHKAIIRDIVLVSEAPGPFQWRHIVEEVIAKHGCTYAQLVGRQRSRELVAARFEAYFRLSEETTLSLPQIGRMLGGKDHTSVLHGIRKYRERHGEAA